MEQEVASFKYAVTTFGSYIDQIEEPAWNNPTPDTQWDVRALVHHVLEGVLWVPDILAGRTIEEVGSKYAGDILTSTPVAAWHAAAGKAISASELSQPDQIAHLSYGDYPAQTYLQHQTIDLVIHAWDLARAISAKEDLDPDLVRVTWEWFEPQAEEWRASGLLGPAFRAPEDATLQTKLLALSGRKI